MRLIQFVDRLSDRLASIEWNNRTRRDRLKWVSLLIGEMAAVLGGLAALLHHSDDGAAWGPIVAICGGLWLWFSTFLALIVWRPRTAFKVGFLGTPFVVVVIVGAALVVGGA